MGVEVCPVHRTEFKSSNIEVFNAADMQTDESRGIKRSAEDEEEEEENIRLRPETHQERREYIASAYKRLNTYNLKKQVLLCNFIRSIHLDMEKDGIHVPELYDENGRPRGPHIPEWRHRVIPSMLDPPPNLSVMNSVDSRPGSPTSVIHREDHNDSEFSSEYERCFMDETLKLNSFSRTSFDRMEQSALWTEEGDRLARLNWCSVLTSSFNGSDSSSSDYISEDSNSSNLHTLMPAATEVEYFDMPSSNTNSSECPPGNTSPVSGSSSSEDEIFGDVDLTLYDFDCHELSPPSVAMDPLSAEELVWSLSNDQRQASSSDFITSVST